MIDYIWKSCKKDLERGQVISREITQGIFHQPCTPCKDINSLYVIQPFLFEASKILWPLRYSFLSSPAQLGGTLRCDGVRHTCVQELFPAFASWTSVTSPAKWGRNSRLTRPFRWWNEKMIVKRRAWYITGSQQTVALISLVIESRLFQRPPALAFTEQFCP